MKIEFNLEEVTKRKERALERIETDELETAINSENVETRIEQALEKLEIDDVRVEDTGPAPHNSEGTQMTLEAYVSVQERVEDTSKVSEEIERPLHSEPEVTEKEIGQQSERIPEVIEEANEPREIVSEAVLEELGTREVKMYSPEVRGREVSSAEELEEVIGQDMPGMMEHRNYEKMMGQCENHFKVEERFGHRRMVSSGEIIKFSEEINEPEKTVRAWVVEGARPVMYPTLESAMTKEEAEEKIGKVRESLQGVDSFEELEHRLNHPYHENHTKTQVSYPKDLESARKYYEFLDEMAKGGTIADVSKRVGFSQSNGSRYLEGRITRLINRAIEPVPDFEPIEVKEKLHIDTPEKYERALQRHPFVKDLPDFKQLDHEARVYTTLTEMKMKGELPEKMVKELAKENKVGEQQLASWLSERKTQDFITRLEAYERARESHEAKLAKDAFEHRIDPSTVYEHFQHLKDVKEPTPDQLAQAIESMYQKSELSTRVQWGELRPYHSGGPKWLRDIAQSIHEQRAEVETALNTRIGLDADPNKKLRLGVLDSKLYLRREDTSEWNWLNIYKNEQFHFNSQEQKNLLVDETKDRLGVYGAKRLSDLVDQMTDYKIVNTSGLPNYDLVSTTPYLRGETLHLSLDATGKNIQDIQSRIEKIGQARKGVGGINNPQFTMNATEIESMFTSLLGTGLSDGHIELSNSGFVYTESNRDRVDIVNKQIDQFGEVYRSEAIQPNGVIRTRYASAYGRALEGRGLTKGDKTLQNEGWPQWLEESTGIPNLEYYRSLWVQDGSFIVDKNGRAVFKVDRGVVLRDPKKSLEYDIENAASEEMAEFARDHGDRTESKLFNVRFELKHGTLEELEESKDENVAVLANELRSVVMDTKPKLLIAEQNGLKKHGIETREYFVYLTYSENTGRLSALWHYETGTKKDAMRVALKCSPDDIHKSRKVERWVESQPDLKKEIEHEIEGE